MTKHELRALVLERRKSINDSQISDASERIVRKIIQTEDFIKSDIIAIYYPLNKEIDLLELMKLKTVVFPSIKTKEIVFHKVTSLDILEDGKFNLKEPPLTSEIVNPDKIDCMYIPGLVFSKSLKRIGYGKGFYDRYLKSYHGLKVGVCMKEFLTEDFSTDHHDIKMDYIITD